ncbi:hypothetical protein [Pseudoalteromonas sp. NBT06-2]|uniref:hypothetical protein n=1 Tax=Pseudoalteromonas sp. NBT06-2 TaxID=2025950 RepID=UPI002075380E|nr:hypothetical protein [Pseudoalteromonas sp. NBT06-2]
MRLDYELLSSPEPHILKWLGYMPDVLLSQLYDVNNNITLGLQIGIHSTGEREMTIKYLNKTQTGDLVIYDRGFGFIINRS